MTRPLMLHPLTTFAAGALTVTLVAVMLAAACSAPNRSAATLQAYQEALRAANHPGPAAGTPAEAAALGRFTRLLENLHDADYLRRHVRETYAPDAFLNDTLATHRGAAEIEAYFLKTSAAMTSYTVKIDDVARSGPDFYIRWTMTFAAKPLAKGTPVHSTGISQVRFNEDGKVAVHQDFWDSANFFGHAPLSGPAIEFIRNRASSN